MSRTHADAKWFTYFPDNLRWSLSICWMISCARWGASEIGEIDQVGRRLGKKLGDDAHWLREWSAMGNRVFALAEKEQNQGHNLTAAAHYLRACYYFQMGERLISPKNKKALNIYRKSIDCFRRYARLTDRPRIQPVEIPYGKGKKLPAYLVHAENTKKTKPPVVVFFDGRDVTKEIQYICGVQDLVRRGMSCLIVDGPGTGESVRFRDIYLRHDYEVAGSAALDYLETRKDVNAKKTGVLGISLGGYYATRAASLEPRYKACVAWGANWEYQKTWKVRGIPAHSYMEIMNAHSQEEMQVEFDKFSLKGVAGKMRCPFLLTHGADDQMVPMREARAHFRAVGSKDKTFRVFSAREGGAQHCQIDNMTLGTTCIQDWLQEKLK
ncbi:MAG: alpha/beta hydrolase [Nitrospinaceae bacterium]|jgi:dipeptidyl aminopeptidase/acylaminoacyl peptidase|nr:alpha/beta hydrolase [Nitrospinaceae bacterium]MBT3432281.1 alpha/beta hydrolase [Nitrospinaceae bacterium]MBT3822210.1 alpha/beta hydrolase [Nitrospinaceae bacterium]MBT4428961.1 alpha/beta hydrolase [Nitrospinaceae bacterium]MBT5369394.1 alpha/beta hydrolase [Nitrospinaceae bacterium]